MFPIKVLISLLLLGIIYPDDLAISNYQSFIGKRSNSLGLSEEKEEIKKVIHKLFDGMRKGDSTSVRSVFYPSAKLVTAFNKEGKPQLKWDSIDEFIKAVGKPHKEVWDERIFDTEIQQDGLIASVWTKYAFYVDNTFSHCGVDAFQLFKGESGWKIIQITDTRYKETCEEHRNKTSEKH